MQSEADKLRSDLRRFEYLRRLIADQRAHEALTQLVSETEKRLCEITDRDGGS
jgi:hypothetical protein